MPSFHCRINVLITFGTTFIIPLRHILYFAQLTCRDYIEVYKFPVHLRSDVLRWISVGLFPPEEPLVHVIALWLFLLMFYLPPTPRPDQSRKKLSFVELLPTWERTVLGFATVAAIGVSNKLTSVCNRSTLHRGIFQFMLPAEGTFQLQQMALSLQFRIRLLVCSVRCVWAL
jgi:hypothetical protein